MIDVLDTDITRLMNTFLIYSFNMGEIYKTIFLLKYQHLNNESHYFFV